MSSTVSDNSYRSILKGTTLLGSVQIFQIVINILRGKCVAIILGTVGMGINALFYSAALSIQQFSSFGLNLALVKELSGKSGDEQKKITIIGIRLFVYAALLGAVICMSLSPLLSIFTFGSRSYIPDFLLLSVMVFLGILGMGYYSILQGLHELGSIARITLTGPLTGLLIGVPIYYCFGDKGIVPALVILSASTFLFYYYAVKKRVNLTGTRIKLNENKGFIRRIIKLGIILMSGTFATYLTNYIINIVIRHLGEISDVGLWQAASSITTQYSAVVFAALAIDYFPRLIAVSKNNRRLTVVVNRQLEIITMMITPLICLLLTLAPFVIELLLSKEFLPATELLRWLCLTIMFRAIYYPMGYITFAKDNMLTYFLMEAVIGNMLILCFSTLGFFYNGITGMGMGMFIASVLITILYYIVNHIKYNFIYSRANIINLTVKTLLIITVFACSFIDRVALSYLSMGIVCLITLFFSIKNLRPLILSAQSIQKDHQDHNHPNEVVPME